MLTTLILGIFLSQGSFAQTILQENFDGTWTVPSTLSPAWSTASNGTAGINGLWAANDAPTTATGWSSTSGGYTPVGANSSARSARFHDYDCPAGGIGELFSPTMDFSSFSGEKAVSFFHINTGGADVVRFAVSTDDGTTWGPNLIAIGTNSTWTQYIIPIGNTQSSTVRIKFRADGVAGASDIGIDEVNVFVYDPAGYNYSTTAAGGLWNSADTWVGGVIPPNGISDITVPAGSILTINARVVVNTLSVSGVLQWNATSTNTLTTSSDITVNAGGRLINHTTSSTSPSITCGGNFTNNGYVNMAIGGDLTMNGSGSFSLGGTGTFEGDGTNGIIRFLHFTNSAGTYSITTSQNLIVNAQTAHFGGTLITNGKLRFDNTANLFGRPINTQAANVVVTLMGSGYTSDPVVVTGIAAQWTSDAPGSANARYFNAGNIYLLTSGTTQGTTAPTHTSGAANNFLWLCSYGTLGTLYLGAQAHALGAQFIYGDNLYLCTTAGIGSATTGPTHTTGTQTVGSAGFLYVGSAIKVSVNRDASSIRSLSLTSAGSGYATTPSITFNGGGGSGAAAQLVVNPAVQGVAYFLAQKSGEATVTGGITINSDQGVSSLSANPQASSGVGSVFVTNGGANYTVAPQLGFAGPTALNLVTNGGSGYTSAPTITVTGGTQPVGASALTSSSFTITVNQGKVVSVYLQGTVTYITPPTLTFSGGGGSGATLAFPPNCWPAATVNIGTNRQITSITMTNSGYGYVEPPLLAVGNASGTATGGTYTTAASGFTSRIAAYYLRTAFNSAAAGAGTQLDDAYIPTSRKMHALQLAGNDNGAKLTGNLTLMSSGTSTGAFTTSSPTPLLLTGSNSTTTTQGQTGNVLDMGGNNLYFSWTGYTGTTSTQGSTNAYVTNGSITLTTRGGGTAGSTLNFPFLGTQSTGRFQVFTGTGTTVANGADILTVKVTQAGAPGNSTSAGATAIAMGKRSFLVETTTIGGGAGTAGTNPTVRMDYNTTQTNSGPDSLTTTQDQTFLAEAPTLNGAWVIRSAAVGASGTLANNGSLTSGTTAPGPITLASGNRYAFASTLHTVTDVSPLSVCANSGTQTITGTNLSGVTAITIGGAPVTAFTIVSSSQITIVAGAQTSGVITLVKAGSSVSGTQTITWTAPSASTTTQSATNSYSWNGTTYTSSGTYTWTGTNAAGCDSVATLNLTINSGTTCTPTSSTETVSACGSYVWHGTTYTASNNTATWVTTNAGGCDSTVTLNLTITPQPSQ
ncbi:MAG: hypothetical protein ACKOKF_08785, partial [Bacteroidota bacterium]